MERTTKCCSKCKQIKLLTEFSKGKDTNIGYKSACKECLREDYKVYREANGKKVRDKNHKTNKEHYYDNRAFIDSLKLSVGCVLCGYNKHPQALQFDHLDPNKKSFTISSNLRKSKETIEKEIQKCRVLCANCHAIETYKNKHHLYRRT